MHSCWKGKGENKQPDQTTATNKNCLSCLLSYFFIHGWKVEVKSGFLRVQP
ncbi:hypothetical protein RHGRI_014066 [Rhododendron griersonianum]|uniref:Uncharacterized protein n=1 Tax=Rhododendron griersonianum TaxID=479676 RepID=A0AAV6K8A4_9ERIC|nr:hypothetical protein RHGRI_014066 [Rhododendron griersonianum]